MKAKGRKEKNKNDANKFSHMEANQDSVNSLDFATAEAYKRLRANLLLSMPNEKRCRIVGVISALRNEGKSTTAINVSLSLAEAGKKVLLIDMDMRIPNVAAFMGVDNTPGLSNYLTGMNIQEEVMKQSMIHDNAYVIPAGDIPPNPSELLGSEKMKKLIESISHDYDFILFDLPAFTEVSDALVVSKLTDGMIVIVRQDHSNKRALDETMRQLRFLEIKILGFVMIQVTSSEKNFGRKKNNKYRYGYHDY